MPEKGLEYYLQLPWSYRFEWSNEDECYIASIAELKGCVTHGETILEATQIIQDALKSYISCSLQYNDEIPEPLKPVDYKGKIPYRTTPDKHYRIAKRAKALGVSINTLIDEAVEEQLKKTA